MGRAAAEVEVAALEAAEPFEVFDFFADFFFAISAVGLVAETVESGAEDTILIGDEREGTRNCGAVGPGLNVKPGDCGANCVGVDEDGTEIRGAACANADVRMEDWAVTCDADVGAKCMEY